MLQEAFISGKSCLYCFICSYSVEKQKNYKARCLCHVLHGLLCKERDCESPPVFTFMNSPVGATAKQLGSHSSNQLVCLKYS